MNGRFAAFLLLAPAATLASGNLTGQSAQPFSLQTSGAVVFPTESEPGFESNTRFGYDVQARYTISRLSIGLGYQRSTVFQSNTNDVSAALSLVFLEPRYVVTAGRHVATYFAGRVGLGKLICNPDRCGQPSYATYGGGAGLLFRISRSLSADLGGQFFTVTDDAKTGYFLARLGLGLGI